MSKIIAIEIEGKSGTFKFSNGGQSYKITLNEAILGRIYFDADKTTGDIIFRAPAGCCVDREFEKSLKNCGFVDGEYGLTIYLKNYDLKWKGPMVYFEDHERCLKFTAWTQSEFRRC